MSAFVKTFPKFLYPFRANPALLTTKYIQNKIAKKGQKGPKNARFFQKTAKKGTKSAKKVNFCDFSIFVVKPVAARR